MGPLQSTRCNHSWHWTFPLVAKDVWLGSPPHYSVKISSIHVYCQGSVYREKPFVLAIPPGLSPHLPV